MVGGVNERREFLGLAAAGEDVLYVTEHHMHAQEMLWRFAARAERERLPVKLVKKSTMELIFESGGRVVFVPRQRLRDRLRGTKFNIALVDAALSYWDRRDIKATGAKIV
jgi:hypothetical protein